MAIRLLWTWALVMPPLAVFRLPLDVQQMLLFYLGTIAIALIITWRYNDNRKH
jgi:hypothetical protein